MATCLFTLSRYLRLIKTSNKLPSMNCTITFQSLDQNWQIVSPDKTNQRNWTIFWQNDWTASTYLANLSYHLFYLTLIWHTKEWSQWTENRHRKELNLNKLQFARIKSIFLIQYSLNIKIYSYKTNYFQAVL